MALAYLLSVAVALVVLAVALRHRPAPATPPPPEAPALFAGAPDDGRIEIVIRVAADQIAARLAPAA